MEPFIFYYENGNPYIEEYIKNDEYHRLDGPAKTTFWNTGKKYSEEYWVNDKKHRLDGPAYIRYYENGTKYIEKYWVNGNYITQNDIDEILEQCNGDKQLFIDILTLRYS